MCQLAKDDNDTFAELNHLAGRIHLLPAIMIITERPKGVRLSFFLAAKIRQSFVQMIHFIPEQRRAFVLRDKLPNGLRGCFAFGGNV